MKQKKITTVLMLAFLLLYSTVQAQNWGDVVKQGIQIGVDAATRNSNSRKSNQNNAATASASTPGGIAKTAKPINLGESYNLKIMPSDQYFEQPIFNDFKIITPMDGNLTLSFETFAETTGIALYNGNGSFLSPASENIVTGTKGYVYFPPNHSMRENIALKWNTTVEKFIGSFTFKLDEGTYYLRIIRGQTGLSTANLLISLKDLDGNEVNAQPTTSTTNSGNTSGNLSSNSPLPKPVITSVWIQEDGVHLEGNYSNGTTDVTAIHTNTAKGQSFNDGQVWVDGAGNFSCFISEDKIEKGVGYNIVIEAKNRANNQTAYSDIKTVNMLPKPVITKIETKSDGIHFDGTYANGTTDVTVVHTNTVREESFSDGQIWVDGKGNFNGFISEDKIEKGVDYNIVVAAKNNNDGQIALSPLKTVKMPLPYNSTSSPTNNTTAVTQNIKAVYIMNESTAVNLYVTKGGHNFIAFEYENGGGAVFSYGPINEGSSVENAVATPAKMCYGRFTKELFSKGIKNKSFDLSAKCALNRKEEICQGKVQTFDKYAKFSVSAENGKRMIYAAISYLLLHPIYGALSSEKRIGQCDNMTSEIAAAGGLFYTVLNTPNWSFETILRTKKGLIVEKYP